MPAVIAAADTRLRQLREHVPDAGGMIIATDQTTARAYAKLLHTITGEEATVILSDDPTASARISQFSEGTSRWLVAVRMVSEGVDVPRLAVGVYATSASTPLFFAQAIGRFVRLRRKGETASIFLPSVPNLLELASELERERNHVLGKPHRVSDGLDDELLEQAQKKEDEPSELENGFEMLGSDAELDQVIFDGSSFGTATEAGSDEEADYLGIPGLLDHSQMRDLLSRRQDEQLQKRSAKAAATGAPPPPMTTHGQLRELRKELNLLVAAFHHRTGKPHGWIHNELRRICGGPPVASAVVVGQGPGDAGGTNVDARITLRSGATYDIRWLVMKSGSGYKVRDAQVVGFWMTSFLDDLFQNYITENGNNPRALVLALSR